MVVRTESESNPPLIGKVLASLEAKGCNPQRDGDGYQANSPHRGDVNPSSVISVTEDGKVIIHDRGDPRSSGTKDERRAFLEEWTAALGLQVSDLNLNRKTKPATPKKQDTVYPPDYIPLGPEYVIEAVYPYIDRDGSLLSEVLRLKKPGQDKIIRQRRPARHPDSGKEGYIWNLNGVDRVLYRLPELVAADPDEPVFIVEGEKDVDRLRSLGLVATCNPGGAGKWKHVAQHAREVLRNRTVIAIPDNDEPGRKHAEAIAKSLQGAAKEIRILDLPDLQEKGDVFDWLDAGGTVERLLELAEEAEPYRSEWDAIIDAEKPVRETEDEIVAALAAARDEDGNPVIYIRSGVPVRVVNGQIKECNADDWQYLINQFIDLGRINPKGEVRYAVPTRQILSDLKSRSDLPFAILEEIQSAPALRPDVSVRLTPGYGAPVFYTPPPPGFTMPPEGDVVWARDVIGRPWADFPFDGDASYAHAVATMLTLVIPHDVLGPKPLYLINATTPGTGKSLLIRTISIIITGHEPGITTMPGSDEEMAKTLSAFLLPGPPIIIFDNLHKKIHHQSLVATLTSGVVQRRRLRTNDEDLSIPNRALIAATGNNITATDEVLRRSYETNLISTMAQPWRRTGFAIENLEEWTLAHRGEMLCALFTLARAWHMAGRPKPMGVPRMGSFQRWVDVIGGILQHAGIPGFLANAEHMADQADDESAEWDAFLLALYGKMGGRPATVSEIALWIENDPVVIGDAVPTWIAEQLDRGPNSFKKRLGQALLRRKDKIHSNGLRLRRGPLNRIKVRTWGVEVADGYAAPEPDTDVNNIGRTAEC